MNKLRTLEDVNNHLELIEKYSKLWSFYLKATIIFDKIIFGWVCSTRGDDFTMASSITTEDDSTPLTNIIHSQNPMYDKYFLEDLRKFDVYMIAMKAWNKVFFNKLHNRIVEAVHYLMERENTEDKLINTKCIKDEIILSFKILDVYRSKKEKGSWSLSNEKNYDGTHIFLNNHLVRYEEVKLTPYDNYKFILYFDCLYAQIPKEPAPLIPILHHFSQSTSAVNKISELKSTSFSKDVNLIDKTQQMRLQNNAYCQNYRRRRKCKHEKNLHIIQDELQKNLSLRQVKYDLHQEIETLKIVLNA